MKKARLVSMILTASLLLTACGGGETSTSEKTETNKDAVFREEVSAFDLEEGDISQIVVAEDILYVEQYIYNYDIPQERAEEAVVYSSSVEVPEAVAVAEDIVTEESAEEIIEENDTVDIEVVEDEEYKDSTTTRMITGYSMDGTVKNRVSQEMEANQGGGTFTVDAEGNIYSIIYQYATYEGDDTTDKVYLTAYGADGSENWKIHLNENIAEGEYFYVNSLYCDDKNQIIMNSSRGIEIYDRQGNPVKQIKKENVNDARLFKIRDNKFAFISSDGNSASIQTLDIQGETFGEKVNLPFNYYKYQVMDGVHYDIYLSDDYGIYGYNIGDAEITKVMDYISSDFASNYLYQVSFIDENTFVAYYYGENGSILSKFAKVPPEEVVDKTDLVIGCYYLDHNVKQKLVEFNKNSQEYRLNIRDYSMYDKRA